jgi:hypothetical protein
METSKKIKEEKINRMKDISLQALVRALREEVDLPGDQEKIDVAEPKGKITAADFKKLRSMKNEGPDHEVAMAMSSLKEIVSNATQLMQKLGGIERNIPGWIQDHITNAENYIEQANQGFHEVE